MSLVLCACLRHCCCFAVLSNCGSSWAAKMSVDILQLPPTCRSLQLGHVK